MPPNAHSPRRQADRKLEELVDYIRANAGHLPPPPAGLSLDGHDEAEAWGSGGGSLFGTSAAPPQNLGDRSLRDAAPVRRLSPSESL